jgi:hypothetical protein
MNWAFLPGRGGTMNKGPGKYLFAVLAFCGLLLLSLFPAFAQAAPAEDPWGYNYEGKAIVAVLPLAGEETEMALRFHRATLEAVAALEKYDGWDVAGTVFSGAGLELPTDMPPTRSLVPAARYALTGGVYAGNKAGEYYLQLWLWDMAGSTMIYTDDLVYTDIDGAMESLPGLVEWLFSHIREVVIEIPEVPVPKDYLFMLGLKGGLSPRWYISGDEDSPGAWALGFEGGLSGSLRLHPLISLQLELLFTADSLVYRGLDWDSDHYELVNERYTGFSLLIPLTAKLDLKAGPARVSPFAGLYVPVPLGEIQYQRNGGGEDRSYSYSYAVPLGFTGGLEGALPYGPGNLLGGLRFAMDFSPLTIDNPQEISYYRPMLSLYLGYEFGFVDRNKRSRP